ncbi:MAG TPA: hypothetical protein VJB89_03385 [Candidatus Nanoarchaeia archaeon]|nr:hypothetical protein [Candidatus Nanoarchaeia archaeon]
MVKCKCGNLVDIKEMKYGLNGKELICNQCHQVQQANFKRKIFGGNIGINKIVGNKKLGSGDRMLYYCDHCGFKFSRKKDFLFNGRCPNCSKFAVKERKIELAQSLIDDVDKWEETKILRR